MDAAVVLALLLLLALVGAVVTRPLLRREPPPEPSEQLAALEAAKESKYREIHDAELDYRMGKLSEDDYRRLDRELRAEAIEILKRLDSLAREDAR